MEVAERSADRSTFTPETNTIETFGAVIRRGMRVRAHDDKRGSISGVVVSVTEHGAFVESADGDHGEPHGYPWHHITVMSQQELDLFEPDREPMRLLELTDDVSTPTDAESSETDADTSLARLTPLLRRCSPAYRQGLAYELQKRVNDGCVGMDNSTAHNIPARSGAPAPPCVLDNEAAVLAEPEAVTA